MSDEQLTPKERREALKEEKARLREKLEHERRAVEAALSQSNRKRRSGFRVYQTYEIGVLEAIIGFALDAIEAANGDVVGLEVLRTVGTADYVAYVHYNLPSEAFETVGKTLQLIGQLKTLL